MDDDIKADMDRQRRRIIRQVRIRLAAVVLLVPLMRDFQRALNNRAVCRYSDELMRHIEHH